jgi:hypothetical protein
MDASGDPLAVPPPASLFFFQSLSQLIDDNQSLKLKDLDMGSTMAFLASLLLQEMFPCCNRITHRLST